MIVYPYSMVAGGVHSAEQWRQVRHQADYQGTALAGMEMHMAQLRVEKRMWVSFEYAGQVVWVSHPLVIRAHEGVLVDDAGEVLIRERCGNRLSEIRPMGKFIEMVPSDTPYPEEMFPPDLKPVPMVTPDTTTPWVPDWRTPIPTPVAPPPPPPDKGPLIPISSPAAPVGVPAFVGEGGLAVGKAVEVKHVAVVPEPSSGEMVTVVGLICLLLFWIRD